MNYLTNNLRKNALKGQNLLNNGQRPLDGMK
jgi:hypothetical protein